MDSQGLSARDLSALTNRQVSPEWIYTVVRGEKKSVVLEKVEEIAKALKIDVAMLLSGNFGEQMAAMPAKLPPPIIPEGYFKLDEDAQAFFKLWEVMIPAHRKTLFTLAEQLTGKVARLSKSSAGGRDKPKS